jgi:hypothetical protein
MAARRRGLASRSGLWRAAVIISRTSLLNSLARFLSCAPLRYMMLANWEWPAMALGLVSKIDRFAICF